MLQGNLFHNLQDKPLQSKHFIKYSSRILVLLLSFLFISCSSSRKPALVEEARIPMPEFEIPTERDLPDYRIDFNDLIEIKFFNNLQFNEEVRVRPDGRISLQRIGDLLVVGRTPLEVDSIITANYAQIIKDPDITVFVREFGSPEVYVLGEVNRPGPVPYRGQLTALQAVALAGGPSREAKMGSVLIIRQDHGELVAARWDLKELTKGDIFRGDPLAMPYDVIYIPRTFIAKMSDFLDTYLPVILAPVDLSVRWFYYQRLLNDKSGIQ